ncbi:zinc finger protein kipf-like [Tenebrio molitor]|jgi:hypothetical protein|uniref:zinc finger protein kipf-like n=1 Tax=Tenebrio molitor TaxID=7067 RepID=UPI0036246C1C
MTMFTLPNFCRVCLKYDKNLIDLEHIENEPSETLMSKLQHCVSEVEWKVFKPLLCHPCIKRLNIAYTFKRQCVQSATMLKSYVALIKDTKNKGDSQSKSDSVSPNAYMMLPNQKYIKIVMGPQNQNTFQNVFLNVVPPQSTPVPAESKNSKDSNQNVFLNINNTFQKYVPVGSNEPPISGKNLNVNQLLTESKSEELSIEVDPTDFDLGDGGSTDDDEGEMEDENGINDWEDVISAMKIAAKSNGASLNGNSKGDPTKSGSYTNFVPILPKQSGDDKMDFINSGEHFLTSQLFPPVEFGCERCQTQFSSKILLRYHIKNFHMGKYPFKCDYCSNEFITRVEYEACMKYHKGETDPVSTSLTLNDFKNTASAIEKGATSEHDATQQEQTDLICDICHREFNSASGLLRHKVRKHNQKSKKKYFIKGMKNAKCDICNREFSTQSYMQLHRKLHLRDDIGYKYKVFGKNRYMKNSQEKVQPKKEQSDSDEDKGHEQKTDNQDKSNKDTMEVEAGGKEAAAKEDESNSSEEN